MARKIECGWGCSEEYMFTRAIIHVTKVAFVRVKGGQRLVPHGIWIVPTGASICLVRLIVVILFLIWNHHQHTRSCNVNILGLLSSHTKLCYKLRIYANDTSWPTATSNCTNAAFAAIFCNRSLVARIIGHENCSFFCINLDFNSKIFETVVGKQRVSSKYI